MILRLLLPAPLLLITLNIKGIDPFDLLILPMLLIIGIKNIKTPTIIQKNTLLLLCAATFFLGFLISTLTNYSDINKNLLLLFFLNIGFFLFFILYTKNKKDFNLLIKLIINGYLLLTSISLFVHFFDIKLEFMFDVFRDNRFMGSIGDPNFFGLISIIVLFLLLGQSSKTKQNNLGKTFLLSISIICIILSQSRSVWAGALLGWIVYYFSTRRQFLHKIISLTPKLLLTSTALVILILTTQLNEIIADRISILTDKSVNENEERTNFTYALASLSIAIDNPFGIGIGRVATISNYISADGHPIGSHNAFAQIFAEGGIIALIATLVALIYSLVKLFIFSRMSYELYGLSSNSILGMLIALCVVGMYHDLILWRVAWIPVILSFIFINRAGRVCI